MTRPGYITREQLYGLEAGKGKTNKAIKKGKPKVDYNLLCALPQWKAETSFGITLYTLPMPPSANTYWRNINGKTLVSEEAREYKKEIAKLASRLGMRPAQGTVGVMIQVYRQQKSGDLDNRIKVTLDALRGVAFEDDAQVTEIHAFRYDDKDNSRIVVSITDFSKGK